MQIPVIARYAAVTVPPLFLLLLAGTAWGGLAWMALIWLTVIAAVADRLLDPPVAPPAEEETLPWSDVLSVGLAVGHLLVLISTTAALASAKVTMGQGLALFFATASFFGQVSHPNAHELIHRTKPALRALGAAIYTSVGFGHHVSAHRLVHHRHVGTDDDPNTPLPGEDFWDYLPRAWRGSFEAGLAAEMEKLDRRGKPHKHITNPYWIWTGGAVLTLIVILYTSGLLGALILIGLAALTGMQILMSDYVQHYGLQRLFLPGGRLETVAPHHSWNAPRGFSSYLMMNAPAHSEHHMHPDRPYERLDPRKSPVPILPLSMPVMAMIALVPPAWHRAMDKRALKVMEAAEDANRKAPPAAKVTPRRPSKPVANPVAASTSAAPVTDEGAAPPPEAAAQPAAEPEDPETAALLAQIRAATG